MSGSESTLPPSPAPPTEPPEFVPSARFVAVGPLPDQEMLLPLMPKRQALADVCLGALFFVACLLAMEVLVLATGGRDRWPTGVVLLMGTTIPGMLTCGVFLLVAMRSGGTFNSVGLRIKSFGATVLATVLATIGAFWVAAIVSLSMVLLLGGFEKMVQNTENLSEMIPSWGVGKTVVWLATVAFYEELIFRGFLLTRLRRLFGSWAPAVIVSVAIFASLHLFGQTYVAAIVLVFVSTIWSVTTILCRSIWPAVLSHLLFNLIQVISLQQGG